jgi:hypothetical protein
MGSIGAGRARPELTEVATFPGRWARSRSGEVSSDGANTSDGARTMMPRSRTISWRSSVVNPSRAPRRWSACRSQLKVTGELRERLLARPCEFHLAPRNSGRVSGWPFWAPFPVAASPQFRCPEEWDRVKAKC